MPKTKQESKNFLKTIKEKKTYDDVFQKGLIFAQDKRTDLGDYSDSEKENLEREKILAMLKVIQMKSCQMPVICF